MTMRGGGQKSFEPTYEELKRYPFDYLVWPYSQFWAYLWGIETLATILVMVVYQSFEPTYEELKPVSEIVSLPA